MYLIVDRFQNFRDKHLLGCKVETLAKLSLGNNMFWIYQ
jgi:hypothetical protein